MLPYLAKGALQIWLNVGYQGRKITMDNMDMTSTITKILINRKKGQENKEAM